MTNLLDCEYEAQLYGFSLLSVKNAILGTMDDVIKAIIPGMKKKLMQKFTDEQLVDNVLEKLTEAYRATEEDAEKNLGDIVLDFFKIDERILLNGDQVQREQYTSEDEETLDKEIEEERNKLLGKVAMANELNNICELLEGCNKVEESLATAVEYLKMVEEMEIDRQKTLEEAAKIKEMIEKAFPTITSDTMELE